MRLIAMYTALFNVSCPQSFGDALHVRTKVHSPCIFKLKTLCFGSLEERLFFTFYFYRYWRFSVKHFISCYEISASPYESNLLNHIEGPVFQVYSTRVSFLSKESTAAKEKLMKSASDPSRPATSQRI